jgi:hypothetical protein
MDITYPEISIIVICCFHNGKEYTKTCTVYEIYVLQVQDEFGIWLFIELFELFFDRVGNQGIETVYILKTYYDHVLYSF